MRTSGKYNLVFLAVLMLMVVFFYQSCKPGEQNNTVSSPDKKITVHLVMSPDMKAYYSVLYGDSIVIKNSRLGIVMEDGDFSEQLALESVSPVEIIKDNYSLSVGKKSQCSYTGNKKVFHLKNGNGVTGQAWEMSGHLALEGFRVVNISNYKDFGLQKTVIAYRPEATRVAQADPNARPKRRICWQCLRW